ncbi:MAG: hypothetical protein U9Q06_04490 [Nanoarchaeota archaeon]|nr:hypothetical protein [Nanoarchaeota archaeon]
MKGHIPLIGSSNSTYFKEGVKVVNAQQDLENKGGRFDKSSQKKFAEGVFLVAPSLYLGNIFHYVENPSLFSFNPNTWQGFPLDQIREALNQGQKKSFILENIVDGFKVGTNGRGDYSLITRNPKLQQIYQQVAEITDPNLRLRTFLEEITRQGVTFQKIGNLEISQELRNEIKQNILNHPTNLYIKPSMTGGGYSVFRINKSKGNQIESDSKEFQGYLEAKAFERKQLEEWPRSNEERIKRFEELGAPKRFLDSERRRLIESQRKSTEALTSFDTPENDLTRVLTKLVPYPIVEEEIPFATIEKDINLGGFVLGETLRPEFRVICQDTGRGFVTEAYTKLGKSEVSANISLGAGATTVERALSHLNKESNESSGRTKTDLERIIEGSKIIAQRQFKYFGEKTNPEDPTNPRDLAVDVIPSRNPETGDLDFYFIEINWQYGFNGLKAVNPEAAERIAKRKEQIGEIK